MAKFYMHMKMPLKYIILVVNVCFQLLCSNSLSAEYTSRDLRDSCINGEFIKGLNGDTLLHEIPKCTQTREPYFAEVTATSIIVYWDDLPAVKGQLEYQIRYKPIKGNLSWNVVGVESGQSVIVTGLKAGLVYAFEIRKVCFPETGAYRLYSEWQVIKSFPIRALSNGLDCDTLGEIEIIPGLGFSSSVSVPGNIWNSLSGSDCNLIFHLNFCGIVSDTIHCEEIYWIYDGTQTINFTSDIERLFPYFVVDSSTTPYLESGYVSVYCEPDTIGTFGFPLGSIYSEFQWDSINVELDCQDTLLFQTPTEYNSHCGEPFEIPALASGSLASAQVGDTLTIAGYPLVLTSVTGSNGQFSGTADVVLPWQGLGVNIPFTNVSVNGKKQITSGSLELVSSPLFDPDEIGSLEIGGQICVPPATPPYWDSEGNHSVTGLPWDPHGFGQDSLYSKEPPYPGYEEGDPFDPKYDPNGFGFDGIHAVTGTIYNEFGCSQAGIDTTGMPCNPNGSGPYYWLNNNPTGPPTLEGIEFANEVKDTLEVLILGLLAIMESNMVDTIAAQRESCDEIRDDMDVLLNTLDYNRDFIYGPDDEYYEEGMSGNFSSRPKPFGVDMERDPNTINLENKHINLYDCDKKLTIHLNILDLIEQLEVSPDLDDFVILILEKIKRLTAADIAQYEDLENLKLWLNQEILKQLDINYRNEYGSIIGLNSVKNNLWNGWEQEESLTGELVSTNAWAETSSEFHPLLPADENGFSAIAQFKKGSLWVNGVHRAKVLEQIAKNNALLSPVGGQSLMPLEISKEILGTEYTILIDRIELSPTGGEVDVYMVVHDPRSGQSIVFQNLGLAFSPNGIIGSSDLALATEVSIRLSNAARLIIHGTPETYISWDCSGFTGMGVDASVEFCREFLTPLDSVTLEPLPLDDTTRVMAHFTVDIPAWGEFVAELSVDPFAITNHEDFRWVVEEAVLDFSDLETPQIEFPENYTSPYVSNGVGSGEWKGFYLKELSATFPAQFSNDTSTITLGVHDVIFDDRGFTGSIFVNSSIVSLDNGSLAGWPFSIDSVEVSFVANNLTGGFVAGMINVPIFESAVDPNPAITPKDCFIYKGEFRSGGGIEFVVSTQNNALKADLFKASEITLYDNSGISIFIKSDTVKAIARLNGRLSISSDDGSAIGLDFDEVSFKDFEIANYAPYFSPGIWSIPSGFSINVAGFNASVNSIRLVRTEEDDEAALSSVLQLSLSKGAGNVQDSLGLYATARTRIIGKLTVAENRQKWIFDRIAIDQVSIDATIKGNRVYGGLNFFEEDTLYGSGFKGILGLDIETLGASVEAAGQFGRISDGYKYFFVDARVNLAVGIGTGAFQIKGFGGGLYYHMARDESEMLSLPSTPTGHPSFIDLGVGISGIQYIPDSLRGIGFNANLVFTTIASDKAFNGNVGFGIAFQRSGGIAEIFLEGNARFMSVIDFSQLPTFDVNSTIPPIGKESVPLSAYVRIRYDFVNSILDGDLDVYLNTPTFKGKGTNGRMVWAKVYFSKNQWYVNIGKPSNRCGIVFELPGIGQLSEVSAYIDIGNGIEPMPALPRNVSDIAGDFKPHVLRGSGKGFAFGASFKISTPELKFLILRATLEAGAGFDVLIQDYGEATCYHSGEKPGIDGWYASGQVYAYLEGKVGVKVAGDLIPILELGVAAALQGRMPNPLYLQGAFGVRYNVLNGLVKGRCKFRFELGQECELISAEGDSLVLDFAVIDYITPSSGTTEVATDGTFEVYCNYPIDTEFDNNVDNNTLKVSVSEVSLKWEGQDLPIKYVLEEGNFVLKANCLYYLPERDTVIFIVVFDIFDNGEVFAEESDTIMIITGDSPNIIPLHNVAGAYPSFGQYNFYSKEFGDEKGFIQLILGQAYLFSGEDKPDLLLINSPSGETAELNYSYNYLENRIDFDLPSTLLTGGGLYKLALVGLEDSEKDNQEFQSNGINLPGLLAAPAVPAFVAMPGTSNLSLADQHVLLQWVFRSSIFETFKEKIEYDNTPTGPYEPPLDLMLGLNLQVPEILTSDDLTNLNKPPITLIPNNSWFTPNKLRLMYDKWTGVGDTSHFGMYSGFSKSRTDFGYPPTDAWRLEQRPNLPDKVMESDFISGAIYTGNMQTLKCESYRLMKQDWFELKNKILVYLDFDPDIFNNIHTNSTEDVMHFILNNDFPYFDGIYHQIRWSYQIPGINKLSIIKLITINSGI